ncbi:unnamed protein product [Lactuca saligna]|uniref:Uncharacterized protein n=1 Tax=Lactuca saligna TaxID=75948 RepID=A0AA35Y8S9_LACSI|nr:unnamed protein product [Lactuca saligna]
MWDCEGNEIKAWRGTRMPKVLDIVVTPNGEYLITIFSDKDIRILNVATNAERVISEEHPITSLPVSGDNKYLIVNLNSQEIHMWDVEGLWEKSLRYKGHKQHKYVIRSCFGGVNSTFIASGSKIHRYISGIEVVVRAGIYQVRTSFSFLNVLLTYFGSCALLTYLIDLDAVVRVPVTSSKGVGPSMLEGQSGYGSTMQDSPKFTSGDYPAATQKYGQKGENMLIFGFFIIIRWR